jgi:hypothetical protein
MMVRQGSAGGLKNWCGDRVLVSARQMSSSEESSMSVNAPGASGSIHIVMQGVEGVGDVRCAAPRAILQR